MMVGHPIGGRVDALRQLFFLRVQSRDRSGRILNHAVARFRSEILRTGEDLAAKFDTLLHAFVEIGHRNIKQPLRREIDIRSAGVADARDFGGRRRGGTIA